MKRLCLARVSLTKIRFPSSVKLDCAAHFRCGREADELMQNKPAMLTEDGSIILLESGRSLLIERQGAMEYAVAPPREPIGALLYEDEGRILMENGNALLTE